MIESFNNIVTKEIPEKLKSRVSWFEYKGQKILFHDISFLLEEELILFIPYATDIALNSKEKSIYTLVYAQGTSTSQKVISLSKETAKRTRGISKKEAIYGLSPFQRILVNIINKFANSDIKAFKTRDEALEFLKN